MIVGERADQVRPTRESDESDAVIGAFRDELGDGVFDGREAVDAFAFEFEVECFHGAGDVDGEEDVDTACLGFGGAFGKLRSRQGGDEKSEGEKAQGGEEGSGARFGSGADFPGNRGA